MKNIETENLIISDETCKRLDGFVYGNNPSVLQLVKHGLYKDELINLIAKHNPVLANKLSENSLYYVFCVAERVIRESGILVNDRGRANMQTAHNQLKNYK